jgi:glycosyltransferase involved in cell wall biosynthesis
MRVLYLTDSLSDLDGVGRYGVRLIHALEELEPELSVRVLLARKHRPTSAEVPARWQVEVGLPPDYLFHMSSPRFWAHSLPAILRTASAARGCDLVHAIKDYPHSWIGLRGAQLAGKPCIATAHGTYSVQPLKDPRHSARARACYRGFARLISVSGYTARLLDAQLGAELGSNPRRVVIPNAVDAASYAALALPAGQTRPWHAHPYTLSMGELKERKGHHLSLGAFVELAERFPQWHHYIVGKLSGDEYEAGLRELVRSRGLERVHFLGNVPEADKRDLMQRAAIFVHTPVTARDGGFEGFGIVYLEAGASGVPVIGSRDSGAEDAVFDGVTGLLVEQQLPAVTRALEQLMQDSALRRRLGEEGRAHALRADWRTNAKTVLELYRAALAERKG